MDVVGTSEAALTLVLREDMLGIWSKMYYLTGEEALATLRLRRVKNRMVLYVGRHIGRGE